ncbi:hypothetical protein SIN09_11495 [Streptomyces sp. F8]|uniref:hypothetical protein n=1 Tax=Streptomyces sp. F8 TaxID=1436085 RepID=UPI0029D15EAC|nr:hypothetical protein [Streptomyces sp. F8]MDX6760049.1 hypothetical protein [Streptomyces sp. F8]
MSLTLPAPVTDPLDEDGLGVGAPQAPAPDLVDFAAHANTRLRERDSVLYDLRARGSARHRRPHPTWSISPRTPTPA